MSAPGTTPGPWAVSKKKTRRVTSAGVVICNAVLRNRGGPKNKNELKDEHEAEANAHLIAAAQDMYDAVEALLASHRRGVGQCCEAADKGIAALARARGEVA